MSYITKKNTKLFIVEEAEEGTYDPASASSEAIQSLSDGFELIPSKETLERSILSGSIGFATPRTGKKSVTASIPCEFRAADTAGEAPDYDLLLKGALGQVASISSVSSSTGHTTGTINMSAGDASGYTVGDIVVIKESGDYHCSPITVVGGTSIDLLVPGDNAFSDNVVIEATRMYRPADSGHPSLTIESWGEDVRKEYGAGCKVTAMALNNFSTGQLADLNFSLEGMSYGQSIGSLGVTPSFETSLPPVILNACVFQNGVSINVNEFTLSIENTLGFITSVCSANGRISSRVTDRKVTGSFNPYSDGTSISDFTLFEDSTSFSIFLYAYNPTSTTGEFEQVVGIYLPQVLISEFGSTDQDGVLQKSISFTAHRGNSNESDEIFIGSI